VDDLAFSGLKAREIIQNVVTTLMLAGFRVSHQKIKVMGPGDRKTLNKLVLSKFVSVERKYMSRIRAGIHNLQVGSVPSGEVAVYIRSLEGSINYVHLMQPRQAAKLRSQPSPQDTPAEAGTKEGKSDHRSGKDSRTARRFAGAFRIPGSTASVHWFTNWRTTGFALAGCRSGIRHAACDAIGLRRSLR